MGRTIMLFIISIILLTLPTGCWDRTEVDKMAIVVGMGIDKIEDSEAILLTVQIVNPAVVQENSGAQDKPFFVDTSQGNNLSDAIRNLTTDSPRHLFFTHNAIVVYGDEQARSGIQPFLDLLQRNPEFRRTNWILVTPGTAHDILQATLDLEKVSALGIEGMIRQSDQSFVTKTVQRKDFISDIVSESSSAVASKIDVIDKKGGRQLRLNGAALFDKDKLVGYTTATETRGLLWIQGEVSGGVITVPCPNQEQGDVVFNIRRSATKLKPSFGQEQLKMQIDIEAEGSILEVSCLQLDLSEPETMKELEKITADEIEDEVLQAFGKAQSLQTDIFGFGKEFQRMDPNKWKEFEQDWGEHFSNVEVTVNITCKIRRIGMMGKPAEIKQ